MTLLPILLQARASADPFFTNDIAGVLKLLTSVVVGAGIIGGIFIRLVFNTTNQKVAKMETDKADRTDVAKVAADLNEIGRRLNSEVNERNQCSADVRTLRDTVTTLSGTVTSVVGGHAELKATVNAMASQSAEQQRDIMAAIMATGSQFNAAFTDLKVEVAKLGERNKVGDTLAEGLAEIAKIMREQRNQPR